MDIRIEKRQLRQEALKERQALSPELKKQKDESIINHLLSWSVLKNSQTIVLFVGKDDEINTTPAIEKLLPTHTVVLPKVVGENLSLQAISSLNDLKPGNFRVLEPTTNRVIDPKGVSLFVVPGLLYDREGYRLGWGKGFNDRLLKNLIAPKVGLIYDFQVRSMLPRGKWDVPVSFLATESGVRPVDKNI